MDNIRNIKCKRPDIDAIYWYVSENVVTDVDRDFKETIVTEFVKQNIIMNETIRARLRLIFYR